MYCYQRYLIGLFDFESSVKNNAPVKCAQIPGAWEIARASRSICVEMGFLFPETLFEVSDASLLRIIVLSCVLWKAYTGSCGCDLAVRLSGLDVGTLPRIQGIAAVRFWHGLVRLRLTLHTTKRSKPQAKTYFGILGCERYTWKRRCNRAVRFSSWLKWLVAELGCAVLPDTTPHTRHFLEVNRMDWRI